VDHFCNTSERTASAFRLVLISGPLCSGKSTLAELLRERLGATILYVRDVLRKYGASDDRESLQTVGAELEATTEGAWLANVVCRETQGTPEKLTVVDSVRTLRQLRHLRALSNPSALIYLTATPAALARRFKQRIGHGVIDSTSYAKATAHPTERGVSDVGQRADVMIDTTGVPRLRVFQQVSRFIEQQSL